MKLFRDGFLGKRIEDIPLRGGEVAVEPRARSTVDAVILAGGELKGQPGRPKATVGFAGRPLVQPVIEALNGCAAVDGVFVVMPDGARPPLAGDFTLVESRPSDSIVDNIARGLATCGEQRAVLLVSCDVPFLTPQALDDFLARCSGVEADVYYPIISRLDIERVFPGNRRTYLRTLDGAFTGGNLALVDPGIVLANLSLLQNVYYMRKSPWRLARRLGLRFVIKLAVGRLTVSELEVRCSELLGAKGRAVVTPYAEIGVDMDLESDLELAESGLSRALDPTR